MATLTPNKFLNLPTVSSDNNAWGGELNGTITTLDGLAGGAVFFQSSLGSITLSSAQADNFFFDFQGTLIGNITMTFPSSFGAANGLLAMYNATTNSSQFTIAITTTSSAAVPLVLPQFPGGTLVAGLGNNFVFADDAHYKPTAFEFAFNGYGAPISLGYKGSIVVPFNCNIYQYAIFNDRIATFGVDVYHGGFVNFPMSSAFAVSSVSANFATLSQISRLSGLFNGTGGPISINCVAGDVLEFVVTANNFAVESNIVMFAVKT